MPTSPDDRSPAGEARRGFVPAYASVADELRRRIVEGDYRAGDRLPSEVELGAEFAVSRSTVREALRSLASDHLVVTQRGLHGGSFVALPDTDQVAAAFATDLSLLATGSAVSAHDLLEARRMLEVPAARLAAQRRTSRHLERLGSWLVEGREHDPDQRFDGHRQFHETVVAATGNPLLEVVCGPVFGVLRTRFPRADASDDFWEAVDQDHRDIADAIASADPDRAGEAMDAHLTRLNHIHDHGTHR